MSLRRVVPALVVAAAFAATVHAEDKKAPQTAKAPTISAGTCHADPVTLVAKEPDGTPCAAIFGSSPKPPAPVVIGAGAGGRGTARVTAEFRSIDETVLDLSSTDKVSEIAKKAGVALSPSQLEAVRSASSQARNR